LTPRKLSLLCLLLLAPTLLSQPSHAQYAQSASASAPDQQSTLSQEPGTLPEAPAQATAAPTTPQPQSSPSGKDKPLRFNWDPSYHQNTQPVTIASLPRNFLQDQLDIWTSPARIRWDDARWFIPLATATGLLIGSDHHTMTVLVRANPKAQHQANEVADAGVGVLGGIPLLMFAGSYLTYSPHARETALLSGEAVADSLVVSEAFQYAFSRERPLTDNSRGLFFQNSGYSFPSNHAVAAWSLASVLAEEYPGTWSRLAAYTAATTVSVARVVGEQHFPSDVLVGSAFGYLIGHYVYRNRHDDRRTAEFQSADPAPQGPGSVAAGSLRLVPYTPGISLQDSAQSLRDEPMPAIYRPNPADIDPDSRGSVYVPMDSWIYPVLDRLAGLGFIPSQNVGLRPWTRQECLRQINEAETQISFVMFDRNASHWTLASAREAIRLLRDLKSEFARENDSFESLQLDSLYSRGTVIAGKPLNRSWDFGQTLDNDYGRPYAEGTNVISGAAIAAVSGRFSFYVRDEFQHAPGYPNYAPSVLDFINNPPSFGIDQPPPAGTPFADIARSRPLEMYAGAELGDGWEFQFGKQELYWGPSYDAPLSWSINAEPTYNGQIVTTRPHQLPWLLAPLGTYRLDLSLGKMSGHTNPARPWFNGQKITFNLGDNFELGFTRWSVFFGVGVPATLENLIRNIFSLNATTTGPDRGKRMSGTDFRYRLPGARWITIYTDSYSGDQISTIGAPRRSAIDPGIYLSRIPALPRVDFRFEVASTLLFSSDHGPTFTYLDHFYVDANLNKGYFVGNSVGRDGRRYEGWVTYWTSAKTNFQLGYRQTQRSDQLLPNGSLPGGGTQTDPLFRSNIALGQHFTASLYAQYERDNEPVLTNTQGGPQRNVTGQIQIKWEPKAKLER